jgi:glycosyltransferase involved in cell wall biosynthesis
MPAIGPDDVVHRDRAVTLAYVHKSDVSYSWHHSMLEMVGYDMAGGGRVLVGGYVALRSGADGLVQARNKAVRLFLEEHKADWLLWLDTDMGFDADLLERLLEAADPTERPVVGALAFSQLETGEDGKGGWRCQATPTVYDWAKLDDGEMGWTVRWDYPADTLLRVGGTGSACILIHRDVFERMRDAPIGPGAKPLGPNWYERILNTTTGQLIGEDLSFCLRAGAMQIPIFVHTGVKTSHHKAVWLAEEDYRIQRATPLGGVLPVAPPATDEVAVLVPVLGRPEHAEPFLTSLRASTGLAEAYAICDPDDEDAIKAWHAAGAAVLRTDDPTGHPTDRPGTFAEKVNLGYRLTSEPWLLLVGSDVRFHPGWLDQAQAVAGDRYHVIGTNDLGNPRVMAGEHSTHPLIRRTYIDEVGASWDGPGVVAHEGYKHWFVDDEVVLAAKQRGVWAMAAQSKVEHLHPLWGKAEMDPVYALGQAYAERDRQQFVERLAIHAPELTR